MAPFRSDKVANSGYITSRGRIQSQLLFIIRCRAIQPFTEIAGRHLPGNRDVSLCFQFLVHSFDQFISFASADSENLTNFIDGYKFLIYVHINYFILLFKHHCFLTAAVSARMTEAAIHAPGPVFPLAVCGQSPGLRVSLYYSFCRRSYCSLRSSCRQDQSTVLGRNRICAVV